jgi:hypothetical protein
MTSLRKYEANRENAQRSTGPRTDEGKLQSRRNAVRHGLTAETVIEILEDPEDYKDFEANIIADYDARTAVERELVLRLASLLWRIRRATGIETDLLRIQAEILRERTQAVQQGAELGAPPASPLYRALRAVIPPRWGRDQTGSTDDDLPDEDSHEQDLLTGPDRGPEGSVEPMRALTHCFLRVANLDNGVLKRLNRYEAALWRQTVQTMIVLRSIRFR